MIINKKKSCTGGKVKKIIIILIALIIISLMNASVLTGEQLKEGFERSFDLEKTLWNGMVKTRIEYSQEDVGVGETIIVTIHFEIDTEKNEKNYKLAVGDLSKNIFYSRTISKFESLTTEDVENEKEYLAWEKHGLSLIESDPDLVLSNENPIGSYNAKFRLNNKAKGMSTYSNENRIPYGYQELSLFVFHESTEYENITDYHNRGSSFRFYIKIKSSAIIPNNPDNIIRYYHRSDFRREKRKQEKIKKREERKEKNMPKLKFEKLDLNKGAGLVFDRSCG
jgi:hypothetical protein